jgi:hypothetical protein
MNDSNLHPILKRLEKTGVIFQGDARKSTRKEQKKPGDYKEFPYYINKSIDTLRIIITEVAKRKNIYDTGFILEIIKRSRYIDAMKERFREDVKKTIVEELRRSYPPYADSFIMDVIKPPLNEMFFCVPAPRGLQLWYFRYSQTLPENEAKWQWPLPRSD